MTETYGDVEPGRTPPMGDSAVDDSAVTDSAVTGHAAIDEALQRLDRLDELDLSQHPEQFDLIHGVLRESLANAGRDGVAPDSA